jgi:pimeloyl-ACP methyl ester carboxylesterase
MDEVCRPGLLRFANGIQARVRPGSLGGVLWIHGYSIDSTTWAELWSLLPGWSHYGIDLPDHGASPSAVPPGDRGVSDRALAVQWLAAEPVQP